MRFFANILAFILVVGWSASLCAQQPDAGISPSIKEAPATPQNANNTPKTENDTAQNASVYEAQIDAIAPFQLAGKSGYKVVIIPITATIELGVAAFVSRALREHDDADVFILDINTPGGRVDAALQIRDALLTTKAKTIAWVHPRAISAGALISLACDNVVMAIGGTIGAATPYSGGSGNAQVDEKMVSYFRKEMGSTAKANGRDGKIAEAMVDSHVLIPGLSEEGKLLTLDNEEAMRLHIADLQANDVQTIYRELGSKPEKEITLSLNWGEKIARFLTDPMISGLLLSIGTLGLLGSLYTRTIGVFTGIGLISLGLFFGGHAIVHLVGAEELILFALAVILLALEAFVIPGFGAAGIAGLICLFGAFTMTLTATPIDISWETGMLVDAMSRVSLSLIIAIIGGIGLMRIFPYTPTGKAMVLNQNLDVSAGYVSASAESEAMIGKVGVALSTLKPSGKVEIDGKRHDARSERAMIEAGSNIKVVRIQHAELIVRKV